jgi:hypothetical protein
MSARAGARSPAAEARRILVEFPEPGRRPTVDDPVHDDEPRPWGALLFILIYLLVLAVFWTNTYLRIWRS